MRKGTTASQTAIYNISARLRKDMSRLAKTHRGCPVARGCGCEVDLALTVLWRAERDLFDIRLNSEASPKNPRRIVNDDNSISVEQPQSVGAVDPSAASTGKLSTRDKSSSSVGVTDREATT